MQSRFFHYFFFHRVKWEEMIKSWILSIWFIACWWFLFSSFTRKNKYFYKWPFWKKSKIFTLKTDFKHETSFSDFPENTPDNLNMTVREFTCMATQSSCFSFFIYRKANLIVPRKDKLAGRSIALKLEAEVRG